MRINALQRFVPLAMLFLALFPLSARPQSPIRQSNSGTILGTVQDSTGAVIPGATVTILNPVTRYTRTATTDSAGRYEFKNLPFNSYHLSVVSTGFSPFATDVSIRSSVAAPVTNTLQIVASSESVTVTASDNLADDTGLRTSIDHGDFDKLPMESESSGLSSLVTATTPGIAADSNGQLHGLGDHASNTFSVDGQQISDQQSKVFSNQLPVERRPVHLRYRRRAARRIRRQDQPHHPGHHPVWTGSHQAHRQHYHLLRHLRRSHRLARPCLRRQELRQLL